MLEAKSREQCADARTGIFARLVQNSIGQSSLSELLLRRLPDLRLKVRIGMNQPSGTARVDSGSAAVDAARKDLRLG